MLIKLNFSIITQIQIIYRLEILMNKRVMVLTKRCQRGTRKFKLEIQTSNFSQLNFTHSKFLSTLGCTLLNSSTINSSTTFLPFPAHTKISFSSPQKGFFTEHYSSLLYCFFQHDVTHSKTLSILTEFLIMRLLI